MNSEIDNSYLGTNKDFFIQSVKAFNLPIVLVNKHLKIIHSTKQFEELVEGSCSGKSINDILNISPSITNITQNHYSEKINKLITFSPVIINETLEGFVAKVEDGATISKEELTKTSFRATAHDLNNIFTNILNSIDLLKNAETNSTYHAKLLGIIENNSNRAADIISSHLRKKNDPDSFNNQIDINKLLDEITTSFKLFLPSRIAFSTNIQFGLPDISGNYTELYRSLYNLLINAKEAISENGSIALHAFQLLPLMNEVQTSTPQKMICVRISDTGEGIKESDFPYIFNPKYSTKEKENISGLGLANVKAIIEKHKGKISVSSKMGEGTTFDIHLPMIEKSKDVIVDEIKHLLIAEDEDTLRELLKDLFESHGFRVTSVKDGLGVLKEIENYPFYDLLILDKKMPNMDGLECISELTIRKSNIPIILATGSTGEDLTTLKTIYKFTASIQKPYKFDELLRLVNVTAL